MKESKMHLINKFFNNETIRTIWDKDEEKYYISVVDVVSVISESKDGRKYWNKLKQRLKEEGNETVTNCHQLKLEASDGKYRMTDIEVLLTDLGEIATRDIAEYEHPQGFKENMKVARKGGEVANDAKKSYEKATNKSAISNQNVLNYQYEETKQIENK